MDKKRLIGFLLSIACLVGLLMVLYPTLSDVWNKRHSSHTIASYVEKIDTVDDTAYAEEWEKALRFNAALADLRGYELSKEMESAYHSVLDVSGIGIMAYIQIPKINVELPIYHGTSSSVLQIALGHLEWSSLPTGGPSTHCVISGHRGLPSARLFTDLPKLALGDVFYVRVLNELLTYEVDQIRTVMPDDLNDLEIVEGKDYFSLVTCTPYGVNTHRLLVRGHRIENSVEAKKLYVSSDAVRIDPLIVVPLLALPVIGILVLLVFIIADIRDSRMKKGGY